MLDVLALRVRRPTAVTAFVALLLLRWGSLAGRGRALVLLLDLLDVDDQRLRHPELIVESLLRSFSLGPRIMSTH